MPPKSSKKKKQTNKEFKLSKLAVCGICVGFVVFSVLLGVVMSLFMHEGEVDEVPVHNGEEEEETDRGFSAGESGLPGLNDPIFDVHSQVAHDPLNGTKVRDICTGGHFTAALDAVDLGKIWIWGLLSHNARVLETPSYIQFPDSVAEIACGTFQLLVRTVNGTVFSAGATPKEMCEAARGEEDGPKESVNDTEPYLPKLINGLENAGPIVQMSAGYNSNAFLTADGKLYFQGVKAQGPFPFEDASDCFENATLAPMPPGMKRIRRISLGSRFTGVLAESEADDKTCTHVFFAGINSFGEMGVDVPYTNGEWVEPDLAASLYGCEAKNEIVELSCGGDHVLLRTQDGSVLGSGWNEHGQLGTHDKEDRKEFEPLPVGEGLPETAKSLQQIEAGQYGASMMVWNDGTLSSAGSIDSSDRNVYSFSVVKLSNDVRSIGVKKASSAFMHVALQLNDDTIRLYGNAIFGHVGMVIPREELLKRWGNRDA